MGVGVVLFHTLKSELSLAVNAKHPKERYNEEMYGCKNHVGESIQCCALQRH